MEEIHMLLSDVSVLLMSMAKWEKSTLRMFSR
jgi:hypothetical protein